MTHDSRALLAALALALQCLLPRAAAETVALFGDLHVHTGNSPDAFIFGTHRTPEDAFRYARGEPLRHPAGYSMRIRQPLDFIAVSDHAEYMGVLPLLAAGDARLAGMPAAADLAQYSGGILPPSVEAILRSMAGKPMPELHDPALREDIWTRYIETANRFNEPGLFTTVLAFEWTSSGGDLEAGSAVNLHRNVFVRSARAPRLPFSSFDSRDPRELWRWMERQREDGIELLAVPHNANLSNGLMFPDRQALDGSAIDRNYAELAARNEPLVEITQIKGSSETHPALSSNDEWASFEILNEMLGGQGRISEPQGSYVRRALLDGLALRQRIGINPYMLGFIGSSDSHNASPQHEEDNFSGKMGLLDGTPAARREGSGIVSSEHVLWSASGLAGVWAESNTREAIFDAMRRREVFATSGPRIRLRFFGGWDFPPDIALRAGWPTLAGTLGVSMGGELKPATARGAPQFIVSAQKDPASAWLQRIQIIKGWIHDGRPRERVYDVVCADGLTVDPLSHRCPDNRARVDLHTCEYDRERGAVELSAQWTDPEFDPAVPAFYYARVLENPSCRWSTWDSLRSGMPLSDKVPATIQERAWSSPIWFDPN